VIRQTAGLALKAQLDANFVSTPMITIYYIQERLLSAFYDPESIIRKTVSIVMSVIIVQGGFNVWPTLLSFLTSQLANY
jgi:hypothetical protein